MSRAVAVGVVGGGGQVDNAYDYDYDHSGDDGDDDDDGGRMQGATAMVSGCVCGRRYC